MHQFDCVVLQTCIITISMFKLLVIVVRLLALAKYCFTLMLVLTALKYILYDQLNGLVPQCDING